MSRLSILASAIVLTLVSNGAAQSSITSTPATAINAACPRLPITPETWKTLNIDATLAATPGGRNMSVSQYAAMNGCANFLCGINQPCHAGQYCRPVKAPAWQVLFAIQEYNNLMNALVDSINYSMSQAQALSASMANDLIPSVEVSRLELDIKYLYSDIWCAIALGTVHALAFLVGSLPLALGVFSLSCLGLGIAAWLQGEPKTASFAKWTGLSYYFAQFQESLIGAITKTLAYSLQVGITSPDGVANLLKGGEFFQPPQPNGIMQDMERRTSEVFRGRLINRILRAQNAYLTIAHDDCKGGGPNGAEAGKDVLSYCDPEKKLLYMVLRAHKKKSHKRIFAAELIVNKYFATPKDIALSSTGCQAKYGGFEHDPFASMDGIVHEAMVEEQCIFNLPVCYLESEPVKMLMEVNHKSTAVACRKGGKLPI